MSAEEIKFKHSKRRHQDENAVNRQIRIAKEKHIIETGQLIDNPHKYHKKHAMDCGNPKCMLCSNPRRTWKELTIQEKRQLQEMDVQRIRHGNGVHDDE